MYGFASEEATVTIDRRPETWLSRAKDGAGPVYLRVVAALETAVRNGELQPGDQLPTQRAAAQALGVDFTTITRAYALAKERGLLAGAVGRGTFVRRRGEDEAGMVDLSMNLPPPPRGISLAHALRDTTRAVLERTDVATLMAYHPGAGSLGQRTAAGTWLAPTLGEVAANRTLICSGAQTALAAILSTVARAGDVVIAEALTYPGLIAVCAHLGLKLIACPLDDEGLEPDALAQLCRMHAPRVVYCTPTLQNPTTTTMSLARRRAIAAVVAECGASLVEDDAYGRLPAQPFPAIASFAPDAWYIATLSKTLSPGLRIAFVHAPSPSAAERLAQALRALSMTASPLTTAVVTAWMREGVAEALLRGVRTEAESRRVMAGSILPAARSGPHGLHLWLDLPADRDRIRLRSAARDRGLALVAADAFSPGEALPNGVRISLGAASKASVLETALRSLAATLAMEPRAGRDLVV
jgi:DNA-binding transcriptional MocR family regulator